MAMGPGLQSLKGFRPSHLSSRTPAQPAGPRTKHAAFANFKLEYSTECFRHKNFFLRLQSAVNARAKSEASMGAKCPSGCVEAWVWVGIGASANVCVCVCVCVCATMY